MEIPKPVPEAQRISEALVEILDRNGTLSEGRIVRSAKEKVPRYLSPYTAEISERMDFHEGDEKPHEVYTVTGLGNEFEAWTIDSTKDSITYVRPGEDEHPATTDEKGVLTNIIKQLSENT